MKKYKCNCCGEIFDEDEMIVQSYSQGSEFWGSTVYEDYIVCLCPYCKDESEDFDEYVEDEDEDFLDEDEF